MPGRATHPLGTGRSPTTQPGQRQDIHVVLLVHSNCCTVFNPVDPHLTTIHTKTSNIRPLLIIIIQVITANYHIIKLTIIISCKTSKYPFIAHYHNSNNETDNYRISLQWPISWSSLQTMTTYVVQNSIATTNRSPVFMVTTNRSPIFMVTTIVVRVYMVTIIMVQVCVEHCRGPGLNVDHCHGPGLHGDY